MIWAPTKLISSSYTSQYFSHYNNNYADTLSNPSLHLYMVGKILFIFVEELSMQLIPASFEVCNGSIYPCIYTEEYYICTDGLFTKPDDQNTLTCQSNNTNNAPRYPLHGPVTWNPYQHGPTYVYVFGYVYSPTKFNYWHKQQTLHHCDERPLIATSVTAIMDIRSFALTFGSDSIWLNAHNWFWLDGYDSIQPASSDSIQINSPDSIPLLDLTLNLIWLLTWFDFQLDYVFSPHSTHLVTGFYLIWLTFNEFIFDSIHTIKVTFQSIFREYHIVQDVLQIVRHWNNRIFHDCDN